MVHLATGGSYDHGRRNRVSLFVRPLLWNEKDFKDFIEDPRARIPGTRMAMFGGVKSQDEADNIWAYVKQFNADGSKK